jgi:hypothetical protein
MTDPPLRIVAAAIRMGQMVYAKPPPARHHTVMWWLFGVGPDGEKTHQEIYPHMRYEWHEQGFITSEGMFVDRLTARMIATAADQLLPRALDLAELFSEDVW